MTARVARQLRLFCCIALLAFAVFAPRAGGAELRGGLKVERILFLGNSITLHAPLLERGWHGNWGMAASALQKDYVHQLTYRIEEQTGVELPLVLVDPTVKNSDGSVALRAANVVNIAEILERQYASYESAKLRVQFAARPDVVVLQFGENVKMEAFDAAAFTAALEKLVGDLKESSNPVIFVPSQIYGPNPTLDDIKRHVVAEDPNRRVFVDLSAFRMDPANTGFLNHPNDQGMKLIADTLYQAMCTYKPAAAISGQ